jgi:NAD(P)-dependent dehydrogenase (short-subunit alcohol dehydrogenase family)
VLGAEKEISMDLTGQSAVVTGAASGIGLALARQLGRMGADVTLADINASAVEAAARAVGGTAVTADVACWPDNVALAELVAAPRVLCLNAGVVGRQAEPVWATPPEEWARVMSTNVDGVINGLRAFVPHMLADGEPHSILITGSLAGLLAWPGGGAYGASKHAVSAVAEQAAVALAGTEVSVTLLCPALVRSGMSAEGADPDVVAAHAVAAMALGRFAVVPSEWTPAVRERARVLADGLQPRIPAAAS